MDKAWLSSNISCVMERADVSGPEWTHVLGNGEDRRAGAACTFMVPLRLLVSCLSLEGVCVGGSVSNAPPEPAFPQLPFRFIQ